MKRALRPLLTLLAALFWASAAHAQTVASGYSISQYLYRLPNYTNPAQLTADPAGHVLYFTGTTTAPAPLWAVAADQTVSTVTNDFTNGGAGNYVNPYAWTDIKYSSGYVYEILSSGLKGELIRTSTTTGATQQILSNIAGFSYQGGLAVVGNTLYFTSGTTGMAGVLDAYNLTTSTLSTVKTGLPINSCTLAYDPLAGQLYFATGTGTGVNTGSSGFYRYDIALGTVTLVALEPKDNGYDANFALDPTGRSLYVLTSTGVDQVSTLTGTITPFVSGLRSPSGAGANVDLVFSSSSSGSGSSLYIGSTNSIYEVSGFPAPAPEPSPFASLAIGFLGLGALALKARRQRRA